MQVRGAPERREGISRPGAAGGNGVREKKAGDIFLSLLSTVIGEGPLKQQDQCSQSSSAEEGKGHAAALTIRSKASQCSRQAVIAGSTMSRAMCAIL